MPPAAPSSLPFADISPSTKQPSARESPSAPASSRRVPVVAVRFGRWPAGRCLTRSWATWHVRRRSAQSHPRQRPFSRERPDGAWACLDRSGRPETREAGGGSTMIVTAGPDRGLGGGSRDADIDIHSGFGGAVRASRKTPLTKLSSFFFFTCCTDPAGVGGFTIETLPEPQSLDRPPSPLDP